MALAVPNRIRYSTALAAEGRLRPNLFGIETNGMNISVILCMSPCSSDYIFSIRNRDGIWRVVSEDFQWIRAARSGAKALEFAARYGTTEVAPFQTSRSRFREICSKPRASNFQNAKFFQTSLLKFQLPRLVLNLALNLTCEIHYQTSRRKFQLARSVKTLRSKFKS